MSKIPLTITKDQETDRNREEKGQVRAEESSEFPPCLSAETERALRIGVPDDSIERHGDNPDQHHLAANPIHKLPQISDVHYNGLPVDPVLHCYFHNGVREADEGHEHHLDIPFVFQVNNRPLRYGAARQLFWL